MPVPSSGQLRLRADINQEINGNDTDDNVSLGTLSDSAGFDAPDTMQEFYGYSSTTAPDVGSLGTTNVQTTSMRVTATLIDNGGYTLSLNPYASQYVKFYFGTNSNVTSNSIYGASLLSGTSGQSGSTYYIDRTGLTAATTYYFGFYAQNPDGNDIVTGSQATATPPLGMSGSLRYGSVGGVSWVSSGQGTCHSTNGWSNTQYSSGEANWASNSGTPTGAINQYGYANYSPYSSLGFNSLLYPGPSNSGYTSWGATITVGVCPYVGCGTFQNYYLRYSRSGYTTNYVYLGGWKGGC